MKSCIMSVNAAADTISSVVNIGAVVALGGAAVDEDDVDGGGGVVGVGVGVDIVGVVVVAVDGEVDNWAVLAILMMAVCGDGRVVLLTTENCGGSGGAVECL
ncbi:Hypothetical predicted protein [Octopus vulgaris]|uniref:Uncharacterized protein n=1 Tax=Octopus vulgaris TaxID=6645 RepID=A0AA36AKE1_OCTVU|nr:Hypothetical predicted protein [Octopus vulgaris]